MVKKLDWFVRRAKGYRYWNDEICGFAGMPPQTISMRVSSWAKEYACEMMRKTRKLGYSGKSLFSFLFAFKPLPFPVLIFDKNKSEALSVSDNPNSFKM